jgi:hypothetical protein
MQRMSLQANTILQTLHIHDKDGPPKQIEITEAAYLDGMEGDTRTKKDRKRSARRCCQSLQKAGLVTLGWGFYCNFHPYEEYKTLARMTGGRVGNDIKEMYDRGREFTRVRVVRLTDAGREIAQHLDVLP